MASAPMATGKAGQLSSSRAWQPPPRRGCERRGASLVERDRVRLLGSPGVSVSTLRLFEALARHPVVTLASVVKLLKTTKPTAASAISSLEKAGVLSETTGRQRDRVFTYATYLERLRSGTDLAE